MCAKCATKAETRNIANIGDIVNGQGVLRDLWPKNKNCLSGSSQVKLLLGHGWICTPKRRGRLRIAVMVDSGDA